MTGCCWEVGWFGSSTRDVCDVMLVLGGLEGGRGEQARCATRRVQHSIFTFFLRVGGETDNECLFPTHVAAHVFELPPSSQSQPARWNRSSRLDGDERTHGGGFVKSLPESSTSVGR